MPKTDTIKLLVEQAVSQLRIASTALAAFRNEMQPVERTVYPDPDPEPELTPTPPEEPNIPDDDVPLADLPGETFEEELLDEDVPLADVPNTGDDRHPLLWGGLRGLSLLGITALLGKKREEEEG